jgi:hypothetical protein
MEIRIYYVHNTFKAILYRLISVVVFGNKLKEGSMLVGVFLEGTIPTC